MNRLRLEWLLIVLIVGLSAWPVSAEPPTLQDFLAAMQLSEKDVEKARAGEILTGSADASHDRELVATMAFLIPGVLPDELVESAKTGLLEEVDEQTIVFSMLPEEPTLESFAGLQLRPEDVRLFSRAKAGDALNLSAAEIDTLQKLGKEPSAGQVEKAVHAALLTRIRLYKQAGLGGIPPYQRSGDETRSPAEDLKKATLASKEIQRIAPAAYQLLLEYPDTKPEGVEETYRWAYLDAQDEPTIALTHNLYVPEGDSWIIIQRQFYVSKGYNNGQAIAAFVPVSQGTASLLV